MIPLAELLILFLPLWLLILALLASASLIRLVQWSRGRRLLGTIASPAIAAGGPRTAPTHFRVRIPRLRVPLRFRHAWYRLVWTCFRESALIESYTAGYRFADRVSDQKIQVLRVEINSALAALKTEYTIEVRTVYARGRVPSSVELN